jgi:hypothetical protein
LAGVFADLAHYLAGCNHQPVLFIVLTFQPGLPAAPGKFFLDCQRSRALHLASSGTT